jgi:three-Cys-motif partner protein
LANVDDHPPHDDGRLFDLAPTLVRASGVSGDSGSKKPHLQLVEASPQLKLDGAPLHYSRLDGLMVRGVQPHSAQKAEQVFRGLDTVSFAMSGKWFSLKFGMQYVEFYSGPGRLIDEKTQNEMPGSPFDALSVRRPFTRYVFNDHSPECTAALKARVGDRSDVVIETGDANCPDHIETIASHLDQRALTIIYLDPARPGHLVFETVQYLSKHLPYADLIINLPVHGLRRAVLGAGATYAGAGAAGGFLNHPQPRKLMRGQDEHIVSAIRNWYDEQLMGLGFVKPSRRTVSFDKGSPYYDILYCSRHPIGVQLWNKTNPNPVAQQLGLLGGGMGS